MDQAQKHRPDVILMDMRMPELDGYEATKRLKANPALKHIAVIAVTASSFREEEARARKACDFSGRHRFISIERGEMQLNLAPIDLAGAVVAVLETQRPRAAAKQQTLHWQNEAGAVSVLADATVLTFSSASG